MCIRDRLPDAGNLPKASAHLIFGLSVRTRPEFVDHFGGRSRLEEIGGLFGQGLRSAQNEVSPSSNDVTSITATDNR